MKDSTPPQGSVPRQLSPSQKLNRGLSNDGRWEKTNFKKVISDRLLAIPKTAPAAFANTLRETMLRPRISVTENIMVMSLM
jgi:hypothetical protein